MNRLEKDRLTRLLRAGDPAADGSTPSSEEAMRLRSRVLRAGRESRRGAWLPLAVAATFLFSILLLRPLGDDRERGESLDASAEQRTSPSPRVIARGDTNRQIQFATREGTQIIWVLNPHLSLPEARP